VEFTHHIDKKRRGHSGTENSKAPPQRAEKKINPLTKHRELRATAAEK
jgi:hypothetical protein